MTVFRRLSKSLLRLSRQVTDPLSTEPLVLFDFKTKDDVENNWRVSSDASFGGCSSGQVSLVEVMSSSEQQKEGYCMRFDGIYSREIDRERAHPRLKKSGFVSMTGRRLDSMDSYMDLECYKSLVYSIRVHPCLQEKGIQQGERTFLANIRTDNWVIGGDGASEDVWQAVLHTTHGQGTASTPSRLHPSFIDVEIPLSDFILTWRGRVVDAPVEIGRTKITALGISILGNEDQHEGPFCIDVLQIRALHESDSHITSSLQDQS